MDGLLEVRLGTGDILKEESRAGLKTMVLSLRVSEMIWLIPNAPGPPPVTSGLTLEVGVPEINNTHFSVIPTDTESTFSPLMEG